LQAALQKIDFGGGSVPVRFVRNSKARRYILRMLPGGAARVTIPRGGSLEHARGFAERNQAWIEKQLRKAPPGWGHGTMVLLRGEPMPIVMDGDCATLGGYRFPIPSGTDPRAGIEAGLRAVAEPELISRTIELASQYGPRMRRARVRNQRSRWGSCSRAGDISLNWRLIQTPLFVRDYIIVHELMHLREMNHSERFWNHVAAAFPAYREAERWLRKNSGLLR
jgi:predicted metal-dependent hydrolase